MHRPQLDALVAEHGGLRGLTALLQAPATASARSSTGSAWRRTPRSRRTCARASTSSSTSRCPGPAPWTCTPGSTCPGTSGSCGCSATSRSPPDSAAAARRPGCGGRCAGRRTGRRRSRSCSCWRRAAVVPKPAPPGHLVDGQVGGLQQQPGVVDALLEQPLGRAQPGLGAEAPGERAHAHPGVRGQLRAGSTGSCSRCRRPLPGRRGARVGGLRAPAARCTAPGRRRATAAPRSGGPPGWRPRCRGRGG